MFDLILVTIMVLCLMGCVSCASKLQDKPSEEYKLLFEVFAISGLVSALLGLVRVFL